MAFYEWKGSNENHEHHDDRGRFSYGKADNYNFNAHWHKATELILITEGSILVGVDDKHQVMREGEIVICQSGQVHYSKTMGEHTKSLFVIFEPSFIEDLRSDLSFPITFLDKEQQRRLNVPESVMDDIRRYFYLISEEIELKQNLYLQMSESYLTAMMGLLIRHVASNGAKGGPGGGKSPGIMQKAMQYIDRNYAADISLEKLSWDLAVSPYYLSRLFGRITGKTYISYLSHVRISRAKIMICNTDSTILEIALNCGFSNIRTFNRVFKEEVGMTPTQYRYEMKKL